MFFHIISGSDEEGGEDSSEESGKDWDELEEEAKKGNTKGVPLFFHSYFTATPWRLI